MRTANTHGAANLRHAAPSFWLIDPPLVRCVCVFERVEATCVLRCAREDLWCLALQFCVTCLLPSISARFVGRLCVEKVRSELSRREGFLEVWCRRRCAVSTTITHRRHRSTIRWTTPTCEGSSNALPCGSSFAVPRRLTTPRVSPPLGRTCCSTCTTGIRMSRRGQRSFTAAAGPLSIQALEEGIPFGGHRCRDHQPRGQVPPGVPGRPPARSRRAAVGRRGHNRQGVAGQAPPLPTIADLCVRRLRRLATTPRVRGGGS